MASLNQYYKSEETEATTKKTFLIPLKEIYIEDGYNVREINKDHVNEFRDAFIAGEFIPPLAVEVTERGVKVIDGHHRFLGAQAATDAGTEIARLECKDFTGTEADKIAFMVTSSQGMPLSPIERGAAYLRLSNQGWSNAEIAKKVKRSESDIIQHIQLTECTPYVQGLVRQGALNYALAIELQRKNGVRVDGVVSRMMEKLDGTSKKKITRATATPQFSAKKARRFTEIFKDSELTGNGEFIFLKLPASMHTEVENILEEFRAGEDLNEQAQQPAAAVQIAPADGEYLPLLKADIFNKSGIQVWACAAAAFGDKEEFLFTESKFAHTWAADSFEHPEAVVVPEEIIYKAKSLIRKYEDSKELRDWLNNQLDNTEIIEPIFERLYGVASETMGNQENIIMNMADFISLIEKIPSSSLENIRTLRADIASLFTEQNAVLDK